MIKCPKCNGLYGSREFFIGHGWMWQECYLCDGKGKVTQEVADNYNRPIQIQYESSSESNDDWGDQLYGKGEKWGPI